MQDEFEDSKHENFNCSVTLKFDFSFNTLKKEITLGLKSCFKFQHAMNFYGQIKSP